MNDKTLSIIIKAQDQASRVLDTVNGKIDSFSRGFSAYMQEAEDASKKFALGLVGIGVAAAGIIGYGAKVAGDLEAARMGFVTLLGSTQKADDAIAMIKKDAATTPFELPGLISANELLTGVTGDAGRSEGILLNVGKALSAMGKGQPELDRIIENLQQIGSTGKITQLDIRQFGMSGINILKLLADYYGTTESQAEVMVQNSSNAFGDLEGAFAKAGSAGGKFADAFANQAGTFNQLLSNLKDNISTTAADIMTKSGMFDVIKNGLQSLNDFLAANKDTIAAALKSAFQWVQDNGPLVVGIIMGGLIPALWGLATGVGAVLLPLLPFMAIGALVAVLLQSLADKFGGWGGLIDAASGALKRLWDIVGPLIMPALQILWSVITTMLIPALKRIWDTVSPLLLPVLKFLAEAFGVGLVVGIITAINILTVIIGVIAAVADILNFVLKAVISFVTGAIDFFVRLWRGIVGIFNGIPGFFSGIFNSAAGAIKNVFSGIPGFFSGIVGAIAGAFSGVYNAIVGPFERAYGAVVNIADKIGSVVGKVQNAAGSGLNSAKGALHDLHIPGFATGGFTGAGGVNEIAGVVHKGEFVLPQQYVNQSTGQPAIGSTFNMYGNVNLGSADAVDRFFERLNGQQEMASLGVGV